MSPFYVLPQQLVLKMCLLKSMLVVCALLLILTSVHGVPQSKQSQSQSRQFGDSRPAFVAQESGAHNNMSAAIKTPLNTGSVGIPQVEQNVVRNASQNISFQQPSRMELSDRAPDNSKLISVAHAMTTLSSPNLKQAKQNQVDASIPKNAPDGDLKTNVNELSSKNMLPQTKKKTLLAGKNAETAKSPSSVLVTTQPNLTGVIEPTREDGEVESDGSKDGYEPEYVESNKSPDAPASPVEKAEVSAKKKDDSPKKASQSQKLTTAQSKAAETHPSILKVDPEAFTKSAVTLSDALPSSLSGQENLSSLGLVPDDGRQSDKIETLKPKKTIYLNRGNDFASQQPQWLEPTQTQWRKPPETVDMSPMQTEEDSHFFAYFLAATVLCIMAYLAFHNKRKIMALAIEGRGGRQRRNTTAYRRLENMDDHKGRPIF